MSFYDDSTNNLSTFHKIGPLWCVSSLSENQFSQWRSDNYPIFSLVLGGQVYSANCTDIEKVSEFL